MSYQQILFLVASFVCGSIPFAVIVGKSRGVDVKTQGSNNPGASNVYRLAGPFWGIAVFILDAAKGGVPAYLAGTLDLNSPGQSISIWLPFMSGMSAGLGHIFSPFLNFKGGKGVATFLGMFLVIFPIGVVICAAVASVLIGISRYFSVGSLAGAVLLPTLCFILFDAPFSAENQPVLVGCLVASALIFVRHRENIIRLIKGTEHRTRI